MAKIVKKRPAKVKNNLIGLGVFAIASCGLYLRLNIAGQDKAPITLIHSVTNNTCRCIWVDFFSCQ